MRNRTVTFIYLIAALLLATQAVAGELHPLEDIRKSAAEFSAKQIATDKNSVAEVGYLDPRLRLPLCNLPLDAEMLGQRRSGPNFTVTIKCQGESPWTVHVPVKISAFAEVFVADHPLPRGTAIQQADLRRERRDINQLNNGYFDNSEKVVGRTPKRSLPKGTVVSPNDLEPDRVIQRGSSVTIVANSGNITVKMPGKALGDAAAGELVRVENLSSKRVIEATALRPGIVEVRM